MAVALVILSVAVVALSGALAVVARQESANAIPGEGVGTQSGAEPTATAAGEPAGDAADELVEQAATPAEAAGGSVGEPVEQADSDGMAARTATPAAAATYAAELPSGAPVESLSEAEYAALVELASGLKAGTIMFPEGESGGITYRFYTGKVYPLVISDEGKAKIRCPKEVTVKAIDEQIKDVQEYYERLNRELYIFDTSREFTLDNATVLKNQEREQAYAFLRMYTFWLSKHVPFLRNAEPNDLHDENGKYMGFGMEIKVCPKVLQSDIAAGSRLSPFASGIPIRIFEQGGSATIEDIEEWWESRPQRD